MDLTSQLNAQDLPGSCLYIVSTPIGNMGDISFRASHVLQHVDGIACEDTRHTGMFLNVLGIQKPLIALHQHNENDVAHLLAEKMLSGERWAYVSDAGTPGLSDPGARLLKVANEHGIRCIPIPGTSALITLLGVASDALITSEGKFQFLGFLPLKGKLRRDAFLAIESSLLATFIYEAPQRIEETLLDITSAITDPSRMVVIGRELTKKFETILRIPCSEMNAWLDTKPELRGEFVVLVEGKKLQKDISEEISSREVTVPLIALIEALSLQLGSKHVAEVIAALSVMSKNEAYELALKVKKSPNA